MADRTGASFTGLTTRVKLVSSLPPLRLSVTDTVTSMLPLKSASGDTVRVEPPTLTSALPSACEENSRVSPSGSVADSSYTKSWSSSTTWDSIKVNTGGSFTGIRVRVKLPVS